MDNPTITDIKNVRTLNRNKQHRTKTNSSMNIQNLNSEIGGRNVKNLFNIIR